MLKASREFKIFMGKAGHIGGSSRSEAKIAAARRNIAGIMGGRKLGTKNSKEHNAHISAARRAGIKARKAAGIKLGRGGNPIQSVQKRKEA